MINRIEKFKNKEKYTIEDISELVEILRSENGCDWDREQDHKSIRNAIIEETYEFIEGLDENDTELMKEELGDVAFQVFFHAQIAKEAGTFDINDIADGVCKKMVLRHPHVFGDVTVKDSSEVLKNWEVIKKSEKSRNTLKKELDSVSKALPSLIRSQKLLSRYKREGGYVETNPQAIIEELKAAVNTLSEDVSAENISEVLFKTANLSYALKIDSEQALYEKNDRFVKENTKD